MIISDWIIKAIDLSHKTRKTKFLVTKKTKHEQISLKDLKQTDFKILSWENIIDPRFVTIEFVARPYHSKFIEEFDE